jgi:hypothetical protein
MLLACPRSSLPPVIWRKSRPANRPRHSSDLTPEEQANVKTALRVLRLRLGTVAKLAHALSVKPATMRGRSEAGRRRWRLGWPVSLSRTCSRVGGRGVPVVRTCAPTID